MIIYVVHPYKGAGVPGERERNKARIAVICRHLIAVGHCPLSPIHALSEFLDDTDPVQREKALVLCKKLMTCAEAVWVFGDYTISEGGLAELQHVQRLRKPFHFVDEKELAAWGIVPAHAAAPVSQEI